MDNQNLFGAVNALFVFVSLVGVLLQLRKVRRVKREARKTGEATRLLSLNQFSVSFFAYLSFFVYGYSIQPVNEFLVWPRLIGSLIVGLILFEIWRDRCSRISAVCFSAAAISLCIAISRLVLQWFSDGGHALNDEDKIISTTLIVFITLLVAQGYYHQIRLIISAGDTGAIDLRMSQFILMMDISTVAFAISLGLAKGWPLLLLAAVSGITKLIVMYLFYWVRTSPVALMRRSHI